MKGDLYLPPETPAASATVPAPTEADQVESDKGERKTIPATPAPALSR